MQLCLPKTLQHKGVLDHRWKEVFSSGVPTEKMLVFVGKRPRIGTQNGAWPAATWTGFGNLLATMVSETNDGQLDNREDSLRVNSLNMELKQCPIMIQFKKRYKKNDYHKVQG